MPHDRSIWNPELQPKWIIGTNQTLVQSLTNIFIDSNIQIFSSFVSKSIGVSHPALVIRFSLEKRT